MAKSNKPSSKLIISGKAKKDLSKNQQTFNRYIKSIENLQLEIKETESILDENLEYYGKFIYPLEQARLNLFPELTKRMYFFYKGKYPVSNANKIILKKMIMRQLEILIANTGDLPDDELKKIFKAFHGISLEMARKQEFEMMKNEMSEVFDELGVDIDLDGIHENMSEEEVQRKMGELHEKFMTNLEDDETEDPSVKRKKTARQLAKEEMELKKHEVRNKNISSIYRQLVRVLHPDTELDPVIKQEKEAIMQQLTEAYKEKNLHTLLKLELQWIKKEEDNIDAITEDKLAIYNEVLKEQIKDLKESLLNLEDHPKYEPLLIYCDYDEDLFDLPMEEIEEGLQESLDKVRRAVKNLNGNKPLDEINKIIKEYKADNSF